MGLFCFKWKNWKVKPTVDKLNNRLLEESIWDQSNRSFALETKFFWKC